MESDMKQFIQNNREELVKAIFRVCSDCEVDDESIENWINNDEGLYVWAKSEGVDI